MVQIMSDAEVLAHYRKERGTVFINLRTARALEAMDKKNGGLKTSR